MSDKPIEGRCGAKNRRGGFCEKAPAKGAKRCRMHGGAPGSGRPPVHGRFSQRFAQLTPEDQELLEQVLNDPELLDARRPAATAQLLLYRKLSAAKDGSVDEAVLRLVDVLGRRQEAAFRQARTQEILTSAVQPLMSEFVRRCLDVARRYMDDMAFAKFHGELQGIVHDIVAQVIHVGR